MRLAAQIAGESRLDQAIQSRDDGEQTLAKAEPAILLIKNSRAFLVRTTF